MVYSNAVKHEKENIPIVGVSVGMLICSDTLCIVQTTTIYQQSAPAAGLLRYVGLYNHVIDNLEKKAQNFIFLLKIHNIFIFTAPFCIYFFVTLPIYLEHNLVSPNTVKLVAVLEIRNFLRSLKILC